MERFIDRCESLRVVLFRGAKDYNGLLELLKINNAPTELSEFLDFYLNKFYVDDDYFAILVITDNNKESFDNASTPSILRKICYEIYDDYLKYIGS